LYAHMNNKTIKKIKTNDIFEMAIKKYMWENNEKFTVAF
jgi:hypothetical protein